jgi:hypothetical protein
MLLGTPPLGLGLELASLADEKRIPKVKMGK